MKNTKRILSFVLSLAMIFGTSAILSASADETADDTVKYSSVKTWGTNEFGDLTGSDLTSDLAEGGAVVLARDASVGITGYGIYGFLSFGDETPIYPGHTYRVSVDYSLSGKYVESTNGDNERWLVTDCYITEPTDQEFAKSFTKKELLDHFTSEEVEMKQDATYGFNYKTITADIVIPEDVQEGVMGEFRIYTRGHSEYAIYNNMVVYDVEAPEDPLLTIKLGDKTPGNDEEGLRDTIDNIIENDNYRLPKGYRIIKNAANDNTLALGNMSCELQAGDYAFNYGVKVSDVEEGDLFKVVVLDGEGAEVASKVYTNADVVKKNSNSAYTDGTIDVSVPFTASAAGTYSTAIYVNNKANITVQSVDLRAVIDNADIKAAEEKIDAIGTVQLTDECKAKIDEASAACDALVQKYGNEALQYVDNYAALQAAKVEYERLENEERIKREQAAAVMELIDSIGEVTINSEEVIAAAVDARDNFLSTYGEDSISYIENNDVLEKAREDYEKLLAKLGDLDKNGKVETKDALTVLQAAVGKIQLDEEQTRLADVNEDGKVGTDDALQVLQMAVGKIKEYTKAAK